MGRGERAWPLGGPCLQWEAMSRVIQWLAELVELPSVNPAFVPPGDPHAGEQRVAEYVEQRARAAGLETERQRVVGDRENVLVRLTPRGRVRHRLVWAPHMDTVTVSDERQLRPRRKGDRLHGRGACDTKGSLAAMLWVLTEAARRGRRPAGTEVILAALVDEEYGQAGSRRLARQEWGVDLAVVGEPTGLRVVTAHKGVLWLRLVAEGRAAHASTPWLGRSAVTALARAVTVLEGEYAPALAQRVHPLVGPPTLSVGRIGGGRQPNMVPDEAWAEVDRRLVPGEKADAVLREVRSCLRRHGLRVRVERMQKEDCPPLETDASHPWVRRFFEVVGQVRAEGAHFFCDAAVLAAGGTPAVVHGPGDVAQAHTRDEWVSVAQVETACRQLAALLEGLP